MAEEVMRQLGNYRLTDLLGQGGFAKVYLGEHIYLQTKAAIKVLQTCLSGPNDIDGFLKEAKIIAHLTHPHIVRVLDFGIDGETPFLVMDYASNGTLRQRHPRRTQLPLPTIISYVKQIADALQYSHDERLIHRDIKPENMLIGQRNEILLSDFGIALATQSSRSQSMQGVIGTVPYMSPEQIQGKARPASDQYSLGIVVYEWLSGDRPFQGSFVELCTQHLFTPIPPLRKKVPTVLPEVEQVVLKALAKDPKQRFGSVQAFADALEQAGQQSIEQLSPDRPHLGNGDHYRVSSKQQIVRQSSIKQLKQDSDHNSAMEQARELAPKAVTSLSSSLPGNSSELTPASIPSVQNALAASLANLQPSSRRQIARQTSLARRIAPSNTDTTINLLEHARKRGASLTPHYTDATIDLLERARKRGASLTSQVPRSANTRSIDQRGIILIILGTAIFSILDYYADQLIIHNSPLFSGSVGSFPYFPSYGNLLFFGLAVALALFLGAKFGPWVGSVCALIGSLSGDIVANYLLVPQWDWYISVTLIGFISGLAAFKTHGRYNTKNSIGIAVFISFFAIVIGNFFLATTDSITNSFTIVSFFSESASLILTNGIGSIIPLVILLLIDEGFIRREEQKARRVSGANASKTETITEHL